MATKRPTKRKRARGALPASLFERVATAGKAIDGVEAKARRRPATKPTAAELLEFDERAQAILYAIAYREWRELDYLCTDARSRTGAARRFTPLEIIALVDAAITGVRTASNRAKKEDSDQDRMIATAIAKKRAAMRWDQVEPLRTFAREQHDARQWRSAQQAATAILPALRTERDRRGLHTPVDSNAEKWLLEVLRLHRSQLRKPTDS